MGIRNYWYNCFKILVFIIYNFYIFMFDIVFYVFIFYDIEENIGKCFYIGYDI